MLGIAVALVLVALEDSIVFFYSPSDVVEKKINPGQRFRLGWLVTMGSVKRGQGTLVNFAITDTDRTINVRYDGILPDLFREGQGVITEGQLVAGGVFVYVSSIILHLFNLFPRPETSRLKAQFTRQLIKPQ